MAETEQDLLRSISGYVEKSNAPTAKRGTLLLTDIISSPVPGVEPTAGKSAEKSAEKSTEKSAEKNMATSPPRGDDAILNPTPPPVQESSLPKGIIPNQNPLPISGEALSTMIPGAPMRASSSSPARPGAPETSPPKPVMATPTPTPAPASPVAKSNAGKKPFLSTLFSPSPEKIERKKARKIAKEQEKITKEQKKIAKAQKKAEKKAEALASKQTSRALDHPDVPVIRKKGVPPPIPQATPKTPPAPEMASPTPPSKSQQHDQELNELDDVISSLDILASVRQVSDDHKSHRQQDPPQTTEEDEKDIQEALGEVRAMVEGTMDEKLQDYAQKHHMEKDSARLHDDVEHWLDDHLSDIVHDSIKKDKR